MSKNKKITLGAGLLVMLVGAWALGMFGGLDPQVAALEAKRQHVFSGEASQEERQEFRQQVQELTDAQRRQLFERGRPDFRRMAAERMQELFDLPPEELQQEVAVRADRIMAARAEREQRDNAGGGGGGGGGRGGWGNMTDEQRDQRRKQMLDVFEPTTRAQFSEFRRMINTELESRGQDPMSGRDMRALFRRG